MAGDRRARARRRRGRRRARAASASCTRTRRPATSPPKRSARDTTEETEADENASQRRSPPSRASPASDPSATTASSSPAPVGVDADLTTLTLAAVQPVQHPVPQREQRGAAARRSTSARGPRSTSSATRSRAPSRCPIHECTALVGEDGSQLLTVTIGQPSMALERRRTASSCPASTAPRSSWSFREAAQVPWRDVPRRSRRRCRRRSPACCCSPAAPRTPRRTRGSPKGPNAQKIHDLQWPVFAIAGVVGLIVMAAIVWMVDLPLPRPRPADPEADPRQAGARDRAHDPAGADPRRRRHPDRRHADGAVEDRRHRVRRQRHRPAVVVGDRLPGAGRLRRHRRRRSSPAARW